jgi:hypothetical protein
VSLPFFLLPKMKGPLMPWGGEESATSSAVATGYDKDRDRGTNAAVNRMGTFPQVTKRFWKEEYRQLQAQHKVEVEAETESSYKIAAERAARAKASKL